MASNLRVDQILPSVGTNVAIGTATGSVTLVGSVSGTSITNSGTTTVAAGSVSAPSITPTGDSNTGIFFPAADTIAFAEGGSEVIRVSSNANIGIGTDNPSDKLHLQGIFRIDRQLSAQDQTYIRYFRQGTEKARFGLLSSDNSIFFNATNNDSANHLVINSSGNIGIGTAVPSQKLEVVGGEIKAGRVDSTNEGGQVSFGRATDNTTGWYIDVYGNTSTPSLRFVDVSNSAVRATIDSSGRFTIPYQPYFYADMSTDFTTWVPSNQTQAIVYNRATVNIGNHYSTTTGLFTAPVTGVYQFYCGIYSDLTSFSQAWFIVNGSRQTSFINGVTNSNQPGAFTVKLTANDTLGIHPYANDGATRTITANQYHTFFVGYLLG